jgi:hypothetical protein
MLDLASAGDGPWLMPIVGISAKESGVATDMPAIGINDGTLGDYPNSGIKPIAPHPRTIDRLTEPRRCPILAQ